MEEERKLKTHFLTEKKTEVLLVMIDKSYQSYSSTSKSIENTFFRYIAFLLAIILALISNKIEIEGLIFKVTAIFMIISFVLLATIDLNMKNKQHLDLLKNLLHLEDIVGCYSIGYYAENTTLLPIEWLDNSEKYIARKINRYRILIIWFVGVLCLGTVVFY